MHTFSPPSSDLFFGLQIFFFSFPENISVRTMLEVIFSVVFSFGIWFKIYICGCLDWKFTHFYCQAHSIGHAWILMDIEFQFGAMSNVLRTNELDGEQNINVANVIELCSWKWLRRKILLSGVLNYNFEKFSLICKPETPTTRLSCKLIVLICVFTICEWRSSCCFRAHKTF